MLVISRKENQRIFIELPNGERMSVIVSRISNGQVVLAFDAPRTVRIERDAERLNNFADAVYR